MENLEKKTCPNDNTLLLTFNPLGKEVCPLTDYSSKDFLKCGNCVYCASAEIISRANLVKYTLNQFNEF